MLDIAAHAIFLISAIIYMISIRSTSRRIAGSPVGKIGATYGLITGVIALALYVVAQIIYPIVFGYDFWRYYALLFLIMSAVTIGGTATLIGVSFLAYRIYFVPSAFWIATGIIYMITGITFVITYSAWTYYIFAFDGYMTALLIVSVVNIVVGSIEGTICFLVSKSKGLT